MESFHICEGVTSSELKLMRKQMSQWSLNSVSSLRSALNQSDSNASLLANVGAHHIPSQTSLVSLSKTDTTVVEENGHPTSMATGPSPSESIYSIDHHKDSTSSLHPGLCHSRSLWQSNHRRHGHQKYCFFPTLVLTQPPDHWETDYDKYTYGFAWSLSPSKCSAQGLRHQWK